MNIQTDTTSKKYKLMATYKDIRWMNTRECIKGKKSMCLKLLSMVEIVNR